MSAGQQFRFTHKENMMDINLQKRKKKIIQIEKNLIRLIGTLRGCRDTCQDIRNVTSLP